MGDVFPRISRFPNVVFFLGGVLYVIWLENRCFDCLTNKQWDFTQKIWESTKKIIVCGPLGGKSWSTSEFCATISSNFTETDSMTPGGAGWILPLHQEPNQVEVTDIPQTSNGMNMWVNKLTTRLWVLIHVQIETDLFMFGRRTAMGPGSWWVDEHSFTWGGQGETQHNKDGKKKKEEKTG